MVPEEADNINEMMTQFKGLEEEQSAGMSSSAMGGASPEDHSVMSISSTKSELKQAIEAGNCQAVGVAAQRMSDQSVGELTVDEVVRLREVISANPAFNQITSPRGSMDSDFNLNSLIEEGDWPGVIAAAKSASEERHDASSGSDALAWVLTLDRKSVKTQALGS